MERIRRHLHSRANSRGFTLVELIVTMTIAAILAAVTAGVVVVFVRLFLYMPREMKANAIAHEIAEIVIKGEPDKPGLSYSISITNATNTVCAYTAGYPSSAEQVTMTYTYDTINDRVMRTVGAAAATAVPYYSSGDAAVTCPSNKFFTYYKQNNSVWDPAVDTDRTLIRRVEMTYTVTSGSISNETQGSYTATSGVDIKQYL